MLPQLGFLRPVGPGVPYDLSLDRVLGPGPRRHGDHLHAHSAGRALKKDS